MRNQQKAKPRNQRESGKLADGVIRAVFASALAIIPLAWMIATITPEWRLWGVDSGRYLPPAEFIVSIAVMLSSLVLIIWNPRFYANASERCLFAIHDWLLSPTRRLHLGFATLALGILFFALRAPTHFLGDGYQQLSNYSSGLNITLSFARLSSFGSTYLIAGIVSLFPTQTEQTARLVFEFISVLSGVLVILLAAELSRNLVEAPVGRSTIFFSIILTPAALLWFGYVEYYPLHWAMSFAYLWLALLAIKGRLHSGWAILAFAIDCLVHLSAFSLFPGLVTLVLIMIKRGMGSRSRGVLQIFAWVAVTIGVIATSFVAIRGPALHSTFVGLFTSDSSNPGYTTFSATHLLDIFNELQFVWPCALGWIGLALLSYRRRSSDDIDWFLLLSTAGTVVFLFTISPKLGMARDWDLFSFTLVPLMLFAIRRVCTMSPRMPAVISMTAIIISASAAYCQCRVNLTEDLSRKRFEGLMAMDVKQSRNGMYILADYYRDHGLERQADSVIQRTSKLFPEYLYAKEAYKLIFADSLAEALPLIKLVWSIDSTSSEANLLRGRYYHLAKSFDLAYEYISRAGAMTPGAWAYYVSMCGLLQDMGRTEEALRLAEEGIKYHPDNYLLHNWLAVRFHNDQNFPDSKREAQKLIKIAPDSSLGYILMVSNFVVERNFDSAGYYYQQCYTRLVSPTDREQLFINYGWLLDSIGATATGKLKIKR